MCVREHAEEKVNYLVHSYDVATIFVVHTIINVDKLGHENSNAYNKKIAWISIGTRQKIVHYDRCVEHCRPHKTIIILLTASKSESDAIILDIQQENKLSLTESDHCPELSCKDLQSIPDQHPSNLRSIRDQFWTHNDRHYPIIKCYSAWVVLFGASVLGSLSKIGAASLFPWGKCVVFVSR